MHVPLVDLLLLQAPMQPQALVRVVPNPASIGKSILADPLCYYHKIIHNLYSIAHNLECSVCMVVTNILLLVSASTVSYECLNTMVQYYVG